jgi:P27 family predicted phage terminase small subunit
MPKRNSNATKQLHGTARKQRVKPSIATRPVAPEPEAGLDAIARAEWQRITAELTAGGLLTALDAAVLAGYATNYSRWKRAESALARDGEILFVPVRDTHGVTTHEKALKNPMLAVGESAQRLMSRFADQLGLSPASRTKQGYDHQPKEKTDEDPYKEFREFDQQFAR